MVDAVLRSHAEGSTVEPADDRLGGAAEPPAGQDVPQGPLRVAGSPSGRSCTSRSRSRYGLELRPGYTWLDVAELFNAVADGARVRAKGVGSVAALSSGDNVVVGAIQAMLPGLFVNAEAVLTGR